MSMCDGCPEKVNYRGKCSPRIGMQITSDSKTGNTLECNVCKVLHPEHYREAMELQSLTKGGES